MPDMYGERALNGRSQSPMAASFSTGLDYTSNLDDLEQSLEQRKRAISSQTAELEALEARLRATEAELREKQTRSFSLLNTTSGTGMRKGHYQAYRPTDYDMHSQISASSVSAGGSQRLPPPPPRQSSLHMSQSGTSKVPEILPKRF